METTLDAEPECVWALGAELGEGPVWSAQEQAVWFVDIRQALIHRYDAVTGATRNWEAPQAPSFLAPLLGGGFIVGLKSGLSRFDPVTGAFTSLQAISGEPAGNRLNDGAVDPFGRLWFGSMDDTIEEATGRLYRLDPGGPIAVDAGYVVTNGPSFSPDGRTLYHTDTLERTIHAFDVGPDGALHGKRVFVRIEDGAGHPDGSVVDAEGCLWTGLWGGWAVRRYSPSGVLLATVRFPCANITKIAFAGPALSTAYVTSAWTGLSPDQRAAQPLAGGLFRFEAGVSGQLAVSVTQGLGAGNKAKDS